MRLSVQFLLLTAALTLATGTANAGPLDEDFSLSKTSVFLGAVTDHPFSDEEFNENNRLAAIEYGGIFAGYFNNSYGEDTFALGYRAKKQITKNIEISAVMGVTYGYRNCTSGWSDTNGKKLCPAFAPMISYTKYRIQPTIAVIGEAVSLTAKIDF